MKAHLPNSTDVKSSNAFCLQAQIEKASLSHAKIQSKNNLTQKMSLGKCEASHQGKSVSCYADYIQLLDQEHNTLSIFFILLDRPSIAHQWQQQYWQK